MNTVQASYSDQENLSQRSSMRAALVWGLAAIFYFYELMLLVSPSVMLDDLMKTFSTNAEQLGSLAAFYYYAYASMQIPVGLLMDRFGPRILLTLASCFCAVGCVIFGFAPSLWVAQLGRFVMGVGGSFAVVGCLKLASLWFPVNRFALLTGIMVAVGMMGGVFGQAPIAKLVMYVGWRQTALWGALMGGLLAMVIWLIVSDHPLKSKLNQKTDLPPFAQEISIWIKFAFVLILFFYPLWAFQFIHKSKEASLLLFFYPGWFLCHLLYNWSNKENKLNLPIALICFLAGNYLLLTYSLDIAQLALVALSLGFFARLIFAKTLPIPQGLYQVMKIPQVWIASLYAGLMFVPTTGFGQLWGVPYFSQRFHIEKDAAGLMVSMIFFGWAFGGPFYGWISDRIGRRKLPMGFAAISTCVVMTVILFAPVSALQMKVLMFLLGAFSSGFILAFSIVREINAPMLTGTAIGFINTLNNASGALAQPVVGKLLDKQWDGTLMSDGNPLYSIQMFNEALLFLPVCIVIAFILVPFIRETFCRPITTRID